VIMGKLFDYVIELVTKHAVSKVNVFSSVYARTHTM